MTGGQNNCQVITPGIMRPAFIVFGPTLDKIRWEGVSGENHIDPNLNSTTKHRLSLQLLFVLK